MPSTNRSRPSLTSRAGGTKGHPFLQLKVTLRHVRPPVWRRIVVPRAIPLEQLHVVLQAVMGWQDCHLHAFRKGGETFGNPEHFEWDPLVNDEAQATLADLVGAGKARFVYEYDFGDGWEHDLVVEDVATAGFGSIACTGGRRACPPEDCGGPHGYMELLSVLADPGHEDHADRMGWCGAIDPEDFSVEDANTRLHMLFSPKPRRRRKLE